MPAAYRYVRPTTPFEPFPDDALERSLAARFTAMAARYGRQVAVRTRQAAVTYAELDARANRVANALLERRGDGAEPVALLLAKGAAQIAALLGVLKAGKIAMPLDPETPLERLRGVLERCQVDIVLVDTDRDPIARAASRPGSLVLDGAALAAEGDAADPAVTIAPAAPAYILHTSGSTGRPKGVLRTQRTALHGTARGTNLAHLAATDRVTWLAALHTGQGMNTMQLALLNGAALYPWDVRQEGLHELAGWMAEERVTIHRSSASVFRYFVDGLRGEDLGALRLLYLGSEPVYARDVERFRARFPGRCLLVNGLSCTETSTIAMHVMDVETAVPDRLVPVGMPPEGIELLLVDAAGEPVPEGEPGEIAVRSHFLAEGYWREPELTRASFTPDPSGSGARIYRMGDLGRFLPDGSLVHLGRRDRQVKVRGHRVELEEIEAALREHPGLKSVAVVAHPDARGDTALAGYVVAAAPAPDGALLRRFLADRLPGHMVPSIIVEVPEMPMTGAGKIDRLALPNPGGLAPRRVSTAPRTPVEERVAAIWAAVLGLDAVGVDEDFLELGGNSLLATRVVSRVLEDLDVDLSVAALLVAPTVAEMALVITTQLASRLSPENLRELMDDPASGLGF